MTKRTSGLVTLPVAAAVLVSQQAAYTSDTIWDLLRKGDPARRRPDAVSLSPLLNGQNTQQMTIDPKTGQPVPLMAPNGPKPRVKRGGVVGFFDSMGTT